MVGDSPFGVNIPVKNVDDARRFYEDVLRLTPIRVLEEEVVYRAGSTYLSLYQTESAGKAAHTLGTFFVDDIEAKVAELRGRGIVFEEYDLPGLKTVNSIGMVGADKVAWFKDPDGNILSVARPDLD